MCIFKLSKITWCALMFLFLISGCALSPMAQRLDNNFVYACSLQLLDRKISPQDVEHLCIAAHRAELAEKKLGVEAKISIQETEPATTTAVSAQPNSPPVETVAVPAIERRAPAAAEAPKEKVNPAGKNKNKDEEQDEETE